MLRNRTTRLLGLGVLLVVLTGGVLSGPLRGPDPRYHDYNEILALFDTWAAQYPDIFHREIIGYTGVENDPIWAAKISDNVHVSEPEARVMIDAAIHANEANGPNAILYMMEHLLEGYGQNPYYTEMVDNLEMWFVPVINLDGYWMVFNSVPNWDWWRKSKRDNNGDHQYTFPIDGVDCNRNWDFKWAQYDSTAWESSRYKGPYPFSESCVVAMRDLILREMPVFLMDMHSPDVPSIGNKIWWPWYDPTTFQYGPDDDIYQPICEALGHRCETENTGVYVNGHNPAYNRIPKEQCWVYANTGICAFLMEISLQFWWTGAMVDTIAARTGRGNFYLMERALSGPGLTGCVTNVVTSLPVEAEVKVHQIHAPDIGPRMTEQSHGKYWRLLLPGSYTITASAEGYDSQTQYGIYVSASGWTELNFQLNPDPASLDDSKMITARTLWTDTPLRSGSMVHFRLEDEAYVSLDLLDASGRQVMNVVRGRMAPGQRSVALRRSTPSGTYFLRLRADDRQVANKIVVVN
ncbi:MAG: hypothetical protein KAY24_04425 [Candidatus Eisenbacteria sp.]|nr:hypothetical protein [Candidatus Eisenbacteria bacterium]